MKLLPVFTLVVLCTMLHLSASSSTTITPLRFFLRNLFKKKPSSKDIMESGIVEPSDIEEVSKSKTTRKPLDLGDFLSPIMRDDDDDEIVTTKKPKGLLAALFRARRKEKEREKEKNSDDGLFKDIPILSSALRAIRVSGQQTLRNIIKGILPALFSS